MESSLPYASAMFYEAIILNRSLFRSESKMKWKKLKRTREDNESLMQDREALRQEEKYGLKQEKKNLEHAVYDLLKTRELDKQKPSKIRATCDE